MTTDRLAGWHGHALVSISLAGQLHAGILAARTREGKREGYVFQIVRDLLRMDLSIAPHARLL